MYPLRFVIILPLMQLPDGTAPEPLFPMAAHVGTFRLVEKRVYPIVEPLPVIGSPRTYMATVESERVVLVTSS